VEFKRQLVRSCTAGLPPSATHSFDSPGIGGVVGQRSRVLPVVFVFLATAGVAMAQTGATATVRGQVRDPQGRAVSGAKVAVTSAATGLVREAPAGETGAFALTDLAPGDVTITVTAPNFAEQRYTDV